MKYPTLRHFYQQLHRVEKPEQMTALLAELREGERGYQTDIHTFHLSDNMGRAVNALQNKARELGFGSRGNSTFFKKGKAATGQHRAERQGLFG